jgi:uncharacterized protein YbjT (DUF2867 family)
MILVTGPTGNIGRHVVHGLLDAGEPVRVVTRNPSTASPDFRRWWVHGVGKLRH